MTASGTDWPKAASGAGYPPFDVPKPVAQDVWVVDGAPLGRLGVPVPVRMTVMRLADRALLLHSPVRYSPGLAAALAPLGRVRYLLAPNAVHWLYLRGWQLAVPAAETWAAPVLRRSGQVRRAGVAVDHTLVEAMPPDWAEVLQIVRVPGGLGFEEFAVFHRPSRTLVLTDLMMNLEPAKQPVAVRWFARLMGMTAPDGRAPAYLRAIVTLRRREASAAARRLVDLAPDRVIFSHGTWFERDGTAQVRRSLRWLLT